MTDLEYAASMMVDAVRTGDVAALRALADMMGVNVIECSGNELDYTKAFEEIQQTVFQSLGIPACLLEEPKP